MLYAVRMPPFKPIWHGGGGYYLLFLNLSTSLNFQTKHADDLNKYVLQLSQEPFVLKFIDKKLFSTSKLQKMEDETVYCG